MPTETISISVPGDTLSQYDGPVYTLSVSGPVSLYRVRAKKSSAGGHYAFNIEASASKEGKYPPWQDMVGDIDPASLTPTHTDGDDVSTVYDSVEDKSATAPSGEEPEWLGAGAQITSHPAISWGGGDCRLTIGSSYTFGSGDPFSIAVVVDEGGTSNAPVIGSDVVSSTYASWYGNNSVRRITVQDESGNSVTSSSQDYLRDSDIRVLVRDSSNTISEYRRGVQTMTGTLGGAFNPEIICNARQGSSWNTAPFTLSRVLISDLAWGTDDREDVEAWLAWHYGLQTANNTYLPSTHAGYQTDVITSKSNSFTSDIDISALGADTWSSWSSPGTSAINGSVDIVPSKAIQAGDVTIEIIVSWS